MTLVGLHLEAANGTIRQARGYPPSRRSRLPLEVVALQLLALACALDQRSLLVVVEVEALEVEHQTGRVEELARVVHPHVGDAHQVALDRVLLRALGPVELVRRLFEHVTDARARDRRHLAAAHPHAERQLEVLASPHAQTLVERADAQEVRLVDGDRAADQSGTEERLTGLLDVLLLVISQLQPRVTNRQTDTDTCTRQTDRQRVVLQPTSVGLKNG